MNRALALIEKNGYLLFDGAMGTYFASRHEGVRPEAAGLFMREEISAIHREYLEAGCTAIKTNTFSLGRDYPDNAAEADRMLKANTALAIREAAKYGAAVFADMGPVPGDDETAASVFRHQAELFLQEGVSCFLIETLPAFTGVALFAAWLKQICPDAFLLVSFAAGADGFTVEGFSGRQLLLEAWADKNVDAAGLNCFSGPKHMTELIGSLPEDMGLLSVMPNAGYPSALGRRTVYGGTPSYFGDVVSALLSSGVKILGGCCGTTPAHIAALKRAADLVSDMPDRFTPRRSNSASRRAVHDPVREKLLSGRKFIAVEYDPPRSDDLAAYLEGVKRLQSAGADAITLADCPVGVPHMDSSLLACKLKRELGVDVIPHLACRDRNLNAIRALLLGLSAEDIRTVLLVTGDPVPVEQREQVKGVFNCHSRKLAQFVGSLGGESFSAPFTMLGALNVNAANFASELHLAEEKEKNGMTGFLTQPVLSPEAEENLRRARELLHGKLLTGIYPVVSYKNACFMNNEIAGIRISPDIAEQYNGLSREEAEELAFRISLETARRTAPYTDGFYIMTPFSRTVLTARIAAAIKKELC